MFRNRDLWPLAFDMARSGEYANVVMIERELRRRELLAGGHLTANNMRRELLTRVCHTVRQSAAEEIPTARTPLHFGPGAGFRPGLT